MLHSLISSDTTAAADQDDLHVAAVLVEEPAPPGSFGFSSGSAFGPFRRSRCAPPAAESPARRIDAERLRHVVRRACVPPLVGPVRRPASLRARRDLATRSSSCHAQLAARAPTASAFAFLAIRASYGSAALPWAPRPRVPSARAADPRAHRHSTSGYCGSISISVCASTAATQIRANHLRSAGMTYHGAHCVLVADSICENAVW